MHGDNLIDVIFAARIILLLVLHLHENNQMACYIEQEDIQLQWTWNAKLVVESKHVIYIGH